MKYKDNKTDEDKEKVPTGVGSRTKTRHLQAGVYGKGQRHGKNTCRRELKENDKGPAGVGLRTQKKGTCKRAFKDKDTEKAPAAGG